MLLEKGLNRNGLRIRFILQSQDVETHAVMCDNDKLVNALAEAMQAAGIEFLTKNPFPEKIR